MHSHQSKCYLRALLQSVHRALQLWAHVVVVVVAVILPKQLHVRGAVTDILEESYFLVQLFLSA